MLGESRYSVPCPNVTFPSFHDLEFLIRKQPWRVIFNTRYVLRAVFSTQNHRRKTSSLHRRVADKDLFLYLLCALLPVFLP